MSALDRATEAVREVVVSGFRGRMDADAVFEGAARAVLMSVLSADVEYAMERAVSDAGELIPVGLPEAWQAAIKSILNEEPK